MLAWGMTETSPLGTVVSYRTHLDCCRMTNGFELARHGISLPGVDSVSWMRKGTNFPGTGMTMGELQVRGPWVTRLLQG